MQWYGVDWTGPAPQSVEQVTVTAISNHLPQYLYEREISPDSIHMSNIDQKYVLVRAFVNTFSDV